MYIEDFNCDPNKPRLTGGKVLGALRQKGWCIPTLDGDWSYTSYNGKRRSRLDHVSLSPSAGSVTAEYLTTFGSHVAAGTNAQQPVSDHAVLLVEVNGSVLTAHSFRGGFPASRYLTQR